jgi:hypothetical protein
LQDLVNAVRGVPFGPTATVSAARVDDVAPYRGLAEGAGALAVPAHDCAARAGAELDDARAVAFAVADVQGAQLRALACGSEVADLQVGELFAAQAGVAEDEHDHVVAYAPERVVGDVGLGLAQQTFVLRLIQRLGRLAVGALRARQADCEGLGGRDLVVRGEPAQEAVEGGTVLLDGRA